MNLNDNPHYNRPLYHYEIQKLSQSIRTNYQLFLQTNKLLYVPCVALFVVMVMCTTNLCCIRCTGQQSWLDLLSCSRRRPHWVIQQLIMMQEWTSRCQQMWNTSGMLVLINQQAKLMVCLLFGKLGSNSQTSGNLCSFVLWSCWLFIGQIFLHVFLCLIVDVCLCEIV